MDVTDWLLAYKKKYEINRQEKLRKEKQKYFKPNLISKSYSVKTNKLKPKEGDFINKNIKKVTGNKY